MDDLVVYDILQELVERTEEFLQTITSPTTAPEHPNAEALEAFLATRQELLTQVTAQPLSDPDAVALSHHLLDLDAELESLLCKERDQLQSELNRLRRGRRGLQGYQQRPARGRKTLAVEG